MAKKAEKKGYFGSRSVRPENLKASKSGLKQQLERLRAVEVQRPEPALNESVQPSGVPEQARTTSN